MKESSIRCALWLKKQGTGIGDVVSICTDNQLDAYVPELATFYVGAAHNPWHHHVALSKVKQFLFDVYSMQDALETNQNLLTVNYTLIKDKLHD